MKMSFNWEINWSTLLQTLLICILIVIIAWIVHRLIKSAIYQILRSKKKRIQRVETLASLLSNFVGYVIFFIATVSILSQFGIDAAGLIASAGIIGLAIGFGAKDLVSDVVTGFFILLEDQINVGELVTVNGFSGVVEVTGLRVLRIRDINGDLHFIPNREIKALTNHTRGNARTLIDLHIIQEKEVDIQALQSKLNELAENMNQIQQGPTVIQIQPPTASKPVLRILAKCEPNEQKIVQEALMKVYHDLKESTT